MSDFDEVETGTITTDMALKWLGLKPYVLITVPEQDEDSPEEINLDLEWGGGVPDAETASGLLALAIEGIALQANA